MKGGILEWHSKKCIVAVGNEFYQDIITEGQGLSGSCSFLGFETEAEWMVKRTYYRDRYNCNKVWEVVKLNGGYYLRQYICGSQIGRGLRTTKKFIQSLGILDLEVITDFQDSQANDERGQRDVHKRY